jgi:hypothetical protein
MGGISIGRSIAVVLVALLMMNFIDQLLGGILLQALAGAPITDQASFEKAFNRPVVAGLVVVTHAMSALLSGYVLAKLAGSHEVQHAAATAALATVAYLAASAAPNMMVPPMWVRVAMIAVTPPALMAGAYVRGQARIIRMEREQS